MSDRKPYVKSTEGETDQKIEQFAQWLCEGHSHRKIFELAIEKYNLEKRQSYIYINKAWEVIRETNRVRREDLISRHMSRLDRVSAKAWAKDDMYVAMKAYELQAKIAGMEMAPAEQAPRHPELSQDELDKIAQEDVVH